MLEFKKNVVAFIFGAGVVAGMVLMLLLSLVCACCCGGSGGKSKTD